MSVNYSSNEAYQTSYLVQLIKTHQQGQWPGNLFAHKLNFTVAYMDLWKLGNTWILVSTKYICKM